MDSFPLPARRGCGHKAALGATMRSISQPKQESERKLIWRLFCRGFVLISSFRQVASALSPLVEDIDVFSRRRWIQHVLIQGGGSLAAAAASPARAAQEFPMAIRPFTKLAPLGAKSNNNKATSENSKSRNLPLPEIASRLTRDLTEGSTGKGSYILSGDLSTDLFRDDCLFLDPTNRVDSLSQYRRALTLLFDTDRSVLELLGPLTINENEYTIRGRFRSRGFLKLLWNPYVSAYESDITYRISKDDGLIYAQEQTWSKSSAKALQESFTPTIFTPPPKSNFVLAHKNDDEPANVRILFDKVNGRRPGEYSDEERVELGQIMDNIVAQNYPWKANLFPGTWKLVYFEAGGVDRRIPFPEFAFNDQYQVFGDASSSPSSPPTVTNIGQLWGAFAFVRVWGTYKEVDPNSVSSPKLLQADISSGQLCWDGAAQQPVSASTACLNFPISGMGLFESLYLGPRLRILQNLNGTGARGIQIRMGDSKRQ